MSLILKALAIGTLSYLVRRLGTSLILFAYLYIAHTNWFQGFTRQPMQPPAEMRLALLVIGFGALVILFRSAFTNYSRKLDMRAIPVIDQLILTHLNRFDLTLLTLRQKSRAMLEGIKAALMVLLLCILCLFLAKPLAVILLVVAVVVAGIAALTAQSVPATMQKSALAAISSQPDNYVEIILMSGLILGFLLITQEGGLLSGTVLLLMIARFSSAFRTIAINLTNLIRWHNADKGVWARRKARQEAAEAAAEARRQKQAAFRQQQAELMQRRAEARKKAQAMSANTAEGQAKRPETAA